MPGSGPGIGPHEQRSDATDSGTNYFEAPPEDAIGITLKGQLHSFDTTSIPRLIECVGREHVGSGYVSSSRSLTRPRTTAARTINLVVGRSPIALGVALVAPRHESCLPALEPA